MHFTAEGITIYFVARKEYTSTLKTTWSLTSGVKYSTFSSYLKSYLKGIDMKKNSNTKQYCDIPAVLIGGKNVKKEMKDI